MNWQNNTIWFDQLSADQFCKIDYRKNMAFEINNQKYVIIWGLKAKTRNFHHFVNNHFVKYLELNFANFENFIGVESFSNLKRLEMHHCHNLLSDNGLSTISDSLEILHVNHSRKFSIGNEILKMKNLKVLCLNNCGDISDINFLDNFKHLVDFRFVNTNIKSGNLNPIINHPNIRSVGYLNRRHYNIKSDAMESVLKSKFNDDYKEIITSGEYQTFRYKIFK